MTKFDQILAISLSIPLLFGMSSIPAFAGNRPKSQVNLKHAQPLHRNNFRFNNKETEEDKDDSAISLEPELSALCQSFLPSTNPYSNPVPNVNQIVDDRTVSAGSQQGCPTPQNETTIAVNPHNPQNLVAGTNDYRLFNSRENRNDGSGFVYTTFDGGQTWTNIQLPGLTFQSGAKPGTLLYNMDAAGDPVVAFGPNNTVYYANLVFSRLNNGSAIVVNVSHDGGLTWSEPQIIQADGVDNNGNPLPTNILNDKEWITVDQTNGTVYVTWTRFGPDSSPIVMSKSTDEGRTWTPFVTINPVEAFTPGGITPFSQGSNPQVGRNGELYIAYEAAVCQTLNCDQPTDHDAIVVAKSVDGGATFSNTEVAYNYDFPFNPDTERLTLTGENFRMNSFPQLAIDRQTGVLYITWADDRNGLYDANGRSIKTNGDVLVVTSKDGQNWSQPQEIGTDADEFFPAIAAYKGKTVVTFYTRAYDPNGIGLDYAYVKGTELSNFKQEKITRITTETSNPQVQFVDIGKVTGKVLQGVFIGDYTAVALGNDLKFHPSWTDFRGRPGVNTPNQDAYTQSIPWVNKGLATGE